MTTRKDAILTFLKSAKSAYIEDQRAKNIRSSGKSAESLKEQADDSRGTLTGSHYFVQQKLGRRPGKFPPIQAIIDWIREKKVFNVSGEKEERSLAFIIARKISKNGTDIFQKRRPALDPQKKIDESRKELIKAITQIEIDKIVANLKKLQKA